MIARDRTWCHMTSHNCTWLHMMSLLMDWIRLLTQWRRWLFIIDGTRGFVHTLLQRYTSLSQRWRRRFVRKTGTDEYIYERFLGLAERSGTSSGTQHSYKNKSSQATIIRHPTLTLTLFTHSYKDTHRSVSDDAVGFVRKTGTDEYIYERFLVLLKARSLFRLSTLVQEQVLSGNNY